MKVFLLLGLCLMLLCVSEVNSLTQCEFVRIAKSRLNGYAGASVADWVCLVFYESRFNTGLVHVNRNGSRDYGLFQINSKYWCNDGKTPRATNGCKTDCRKFLDNNLDDDIECAKKIATQARGLTPWYGWKNFCRGKNLHKFIAGC
ncbi:lysozyme C-like [Pyxicephalus adspersus]|uniref:lysozyme C-like n=1 Tax=Pyxicephalus adspersus TaxID=30357 RepID=UPI003B5A6F12